MSNDRMINELERISKEAVVANLKCDLTLVWKCSGKPHKASMRIVCLWAKL